MTRTQWQALPESQRETIRQASATQSQDGWDTRSPRPRTDEERARDIWAARDAYRVEGVVFGLGILMLLPLVLAVCAVLNAAVHQIVTWFPFLGR